VKSYKDIVGDGGSRIVEQVGERQAAIERNLESVRHVVAVASGKGGVGKSTLAALIARAFCQSGRAVAVLDADLNGPSQTRLAGMEQAPLVPDTEGRLPLPRSGAGVGVVSMGALVPESEAVGFDTAAGGDSHLWRASREFTFLAELLGSVRWGELDFLVVDLPPGAERTFQHAEFLGPRAAFLLVTIPSELSRGVVSRSLSALRKTPSRILGYVENMTGYYCADCNGVKPLFAGAGGVPLDLPLLGSIPFDPKLAAACDRGIDTLAAPVAGVVRELAEKVAEALETAR
jgi:ATP-binding protein involved in chromosome partitioning